MGWNQRQASRPVARTGRPDGSVGSPDVRPELGAGPAGRRPRVGASVTSASGRVDSTARAAAAATAVTDTPAPMLTRATRATVPSSHPRGAGVPKLAGVSRWCGAVEGAAGRRAAKSAKSAKLTTNARLHEYLEAELAREGHRRAGLTDFRPNGPSNSKRGEEDVRDREPRHASNYRRSDSAGPGDNDQATNGNPTREAVRPGTPQGVCTMQGHARRVPAQHDRLRNGRERVFRSQAVECRASDAVREIGLASDHRVIGPPRIPDDAAEPARRSDTRRSDAAG